MLTHPDYLLAPERLRLYEAFLAQFAADASVWHALHTRSPHGGASGPLPDCSVRTVSGGQRDREQSESASGSERRPSPGIE